MEGEILEVAFSDQALKSLHQIYEYGIETFSLTSATVYLDELVEKIESLSENYLLYPQCRYLPTKSKKYRNMIFGTYLVLYRITKSRIEVLNVYHSSRSISYIKSSRKIKL
jgi:plasmid stabilization system protein ParE